MDNIIEVVWQCFDVGIYTHGVAVYLLDQPIHDLIPIPWIPIEDLCADLFDMFDEDYPTLFDPHP